MSASDVLKMIKEKDVKFVDFRFTDTQGKEQHVSVPAHTIDEDVLGEGKMFDGSSIAGWKGINASDMILMPEASSAVLDPFTDEITMNIRCDVIEPDTMQGYERDPRSVAQRDRIRVPHADADEYLFRFDVEVVSRRVNVATATRAR